ncbi:MAG: hypothetical protein U0930_16370 [Pirellulales bacterium]
MNITLEKESSGNHQTRKQTGIFDRVVGQALDRQQFFLTRVLFEIAEISEMARFHSIAYVEYGFFVYQFVVAQNWNCDTVRKSIPNNVRRFDTTTMENAHSQPQLSISREEFLSFSRSLLSSGFLPSNAAFLGVPQDWIEEIPDLSMLLETRSQLESLLIEYVNSNISGDVISSRIDHILQQVDQPTYSDGAKEMARQMAIQLSITRTEIEVLDPRQKWSELLDGSRISQASRLPR